MLAFSQRFYSYRINVCGLSASGTQSDGERLFDASANLIVMHHAHVSQSFKRLW
jgi:hypothetical protein